MSDPFLSEISIFGFNFAPRGFAQCDGQLLPINQNQALFSLLGTTFGGDGRTTFALPDLRGRVPVHFGQQAGGPNFQLGSKGGEETHTVTAAEMPAHTHQLLAAGSPATDQRNAGPDGGSVMAEANFSLYRDGAGNTSIQGISNAGNGQAHENMQPYTVVNFCIALQGVFPSRN